MKKHALTLIAILCVAMLSRAADARLDSLLNLIDSAIEHRQAFTQSRAETLQTLHRELANTSAADRRYDILGELFDRYKDFDADSALAMAERRFNIAIQTGNDDRRVNAALNIADAYMRTGMYLEASAIVDTISAASLPAYLPPYYYYIVQTLNDRLADYSISEPLSASYRRAAETYRDSLIALSDTGGVIYTLLLGSKLNDAGQPEKTIELIKKYLEHNDIPLHEQAGLYFTLASAYEKAGNEKETETALAQSALADMQNSVREYIALRRLAMILYASGDIERAHRYLRICVDDASKANARLRTIELNDYVPLINDLYVSDINRRRQIQAFMLVLISVLVVVLAAMFFYTMKQRRRAERAAAELAKLNADLTESNLKLHEASKMVIESSTLKEAYIAHYMDQCSLYIEKLDEYRKTILRMLNEGTTDKLRSELRRPDFLNNEVKAFHEQFDSTFLQLFPGFVDDFNALLAPGEEIHPKKEGSLCTELRIFALIRLGIDDSVKIAQFLRYSVTTIYNYRTKVRNKARGDRATLESRLMEIGR